MSFLADGVTTRSGLFGESADATSAADAKGCYGKCDGIMSNDPVSNPDFAEYNKVFIPIGDRTSFTADRWEGNPLFRGKRILDAAIADMMTRFSMSEASDLVLTGGENFLYFNPINLIYIKRLQACHRNDSVEQIVSKCLLISSKL